MENAEQILNIIKTSFPSSSFDSWSTAKNCEEDTDSDVSKLQCYWSKARGLFNRAQSNLELGAEAESSILEFSRTAQDIMSSTASNYDLSKLCQGICLSALAVIVSLFSCFGGGLKDRGSRGCFSLIAVGYGVLMFASSYVEEEQQFWYWILTGWIFYLYASSYVYIYRIVYGMICTDF